ncbi:hypothetical protein BMG_4488 [Priestia megaterium]|nr:hypothetical protein BMG_4488 [Priestia megaterium]
MHINTSWLIRYIIQYVQGRRLDIVKTWNLSKFVKEMEWFSCFKSSNIKEWISLFK